ncbi:MAG: hypothetical protein H7287_04705 [Thermoleophilia bacterium]|nr:hypothetical protein [Thermoleophilia bacterium]
MNNATSMMRDVMRTVSSTAGRLGADLKVAGLDGSNVARHITGAQADQLAHTLDSLDGLRALLGQARALPGDSATILAASEAHTRVSTIINGIIHLDSSNPSAHMTRLGSNLENLDLLLRSR